MASIASRSGTRGLWQPSGCFGRAGNRASIFTHSFSGSLQRSLLGFELMQLYQSVESLAVQLFDSFSARAYVVLTSY